MDKTPVDEESSVDRRMQASQVSQVSGEGSSGISRTKKRVSRKKKLVSRSEKFYERLVVAVVVVFSLVVLGGSWIIGPRKLTEFASDTFGTTSAASGGAANCRNPKNAKTPYCEEKRARDKAQWNELERGGSGGATFGLSSPVGRGRRRKKRR